MSGLCRRAVRCASRSCPICAAMASASRSRPATRPSPERSTIDDPATKVIATFTETVREPERYVAALDRAAAAGKPVVVLKVGRTERTQRAITSHTGGVARASRVVLELLPAPRAFE